MKFNSLEEIEVWNESIQTMKLIHSLVMKTILKREYYFKDQLLRASLSINANIAEGFERQNNNEFIRFLKIAKGSAGEVRSYIHIAYALNYINRDEKEYLNANLLSLSKRIGSLISYLSNKRSKGEFKK